MAQRHKWSSNKMEEHGCTRRGCTRRRWWSQSHGTDGAWRFRGGEVDRIDIAGVCEGADNPEEKAQTGRHQWGPIDRAGWRACLVPGCRWQYRAGMKKPYRVQGAARLGNVGKTLPCKGAP